MTDDATNPSVTLGGETFHIPEFPLAINRRIGPRIMRAQQIDWRSIPDKDFDEVIDLIYFGINAHTVEKLSPAGKPIFGDDAYPLEKFNALKIGGLELAAAFEVVARQAGLIPKTTKDHEAVIAAARAGGSYIPPGPWPAERPLNPLTGTASPQPLSS